MNACASESKPLGFWKLTALVVGNMIGSGIFLLPSDLAKLGVANIFSWGITTIGALFLAIVISRLSQKIRMNGGPYAYVRHSLGSFIGFQTVYNYWVAIWVGNLGLVIALVGYLTMFFPILQAPLNAAITGIVAIWLLTAVNLTGIRAVGTLQLITTILKLIPIVALTAACCWYFNPVYFTDLFDMSEYVHSDITAAARLTLWAFIGVESATVPYDFVKNPQRNIPLATIIGTVISAAVYILSSIIIMSSLSSETLAISNISPFIIAAKMIFGDWGQWIMVAGAIVSCCGCINGWMMLQGQITLAAAEDSLFPHLFGLKNKYNVPAMGLIVTAVLQSTILLVILEKDIQEEFKLIMLMASLASLIPYLYASIAALVIFKSHETGVRCCLNKMLLLIASIAAIYAFWAITIAGERVILYGSILMFTSALLYGWGYGERALAENNSENKKQNECKSP